MTESASLEDALSAAKELFELTTASDGEVVWHRGTFSPTFLPADPLWQAGQLGSVIGLESMNGELD
jgi:hypothetical protein